MLRLLALSALLLAPALPFAQVGCAPSDDAVPTSSAGFTDDDPFGYAADLTSLLQAVVTPEGAVDYAALAGPEADRLARVRAAIESADPAALETDDEKLAFWTNAYNVLMLSTVADAPDVTNIAEQERFEAFFQTPRTAAGQSLTLDQIENGILRAQDLEDAPDLGALQVGTLDPRLHVVLNCAAVSCPPLRRVALTPEILETELQRALEQWVDSERFARVDGDAVVFSSLLDWFGPDFDSTGVPAGDYLLAAMSPDRPGYDTIQNVLQGRTAAEIKALDATSFAYDWTVNRTADGPMGG